MRLLILTGLLALLSAFPALGQLPAGNILDPEIENRDAIEVSLQNPSLNRGIVGVIGITADEVDSLFKLCKREGLIVFVQTDDQELATRIRTRADAAKLLGQRLFVEIGSLKHIHLGNNVADRIVVLRLAKNNGVFTAETSHQDLVAAITGASENSVTRRAARKQQDSEAVQ